MFGVFLNRFIRTDCAERVIHFDWGVEKFLAFIALIASGIWELTMRAGSANKSIS